MSRSACRRSRHRAHDRDTAAIACSPSAASAITSMSDCSSRQDDQPAAQQRVVVADDDADDVVVPLVLVEEARPPRRPRAALPMRGPLRRRSPRPNGGPTGDRPRARRSAVSAGGLAVLSLWSWCSSFSTARSTATNPSGPVTLQRTVLPCPSIHTSQTSRSAIRGFRSSEKCTSARSMPLPKRPSRAIFWRVEATRASERSRMPTADGDVQGRHPLRSRFRRSGTGSQLEANWEWS